MTQPLMIKSKLAGNPPVNALKYSVSLNMDGKDWKLADPRATRALISLMDMNAVLGGAASHYGGPAAFAELMSAMHALILEQAQVQKKEWHQLFNFVNDAGHCENGLYALKANYSWAGLSVESLRGFRSIQSGLTGHGEAHLFPEGVLLSNGPLGSAFPQSQGLALADAHAGLNRLTVTAISDGASMEGEAKEAFAAIPGLARAGKLAPYVLIISDNNTKLSGRIDKESFSMEPSFAALENLGWKVLKLEKGNDLKSCLETLKLALESAWKNPSQPVAVHAKTIKGIGTKKTAESASGGHGFPLKGPKELPEFLREIYGGDNYPQEFDHWIEDMIKWETELKAKSKAPASPEEKIQTGVSAALIKAKKMGLPIVSVTSDLPGSTGVAGFRKEFASESFDVGVAESNMISVAAGMSKQGYIPVVDTFAQFGVTKGALPLIMAGLSEAPMICIFSHTGFQDAADGASHQALSYQAMMASIPYVETYSLSCSEEAESLVLQACQRFSDLRKQGKTPPTQIFFLGRENFPKTYKPGMSYQLGRAQVLRELDSKMSSRVLLVATGSSVLQCQLAAEKLHDDKISASVVHASSLNKIDHATLSLCLKAAGGRVVFVEDHQRIGGFAQQCLAEWSLQGQTVRAKHLAVDGKFGQSAYNAIELYQKHGIDSEGIVKAAKELVEGEK